MRRPRRGMTMRERRQTGSSSTTTTAPRPVDYSEQGGAGPGEEHVVHKKKT